MPPLLVFLFALLAPSSCTPTTTTTAPSSIVIRSRIPPDPFSRMGSRYSLLNSRLARRRPKKKNLDPGQLHEILGNYFDARWMSAEDPEKEPELVVSSEGRYRVELGRQLHKLNQGKELGEPVLMALQKWLLKKGSCPVKYAWEDIGPLFWPRFVRRGSCSSGAGGSCSWPPGMHCVPAGTRALHLLRWQCKQAPPRRGRGRLGDTAPKCSWVVVPYPVTTDCMCTC